MRVRRGGRAVLPGKLGVRYDILGRRGSGAGRGAAAGGRGKTDQLRERLGLGGRWSGRPVQYLAVFLWIR